MLTTTTIYEIVESELMKQGISEYVNDQGDLVFFEEEHNFIQKIIRFDEEVKDIVTKRIFGNLSLKDPKNDEHFKRMFLNRFIDREIGRQTIEGFTTQIMFTFMSKEDYLNRVYEDLDKYLGNQQINQQENDSENLSDNRTAFADLPQNNINIDVDNTILESASDNTVSRNRQSNAGSSSGKTENYRLDELFKINGLLEQVLNDFDLNCFLQIW